METQKKVLRDNPIIETAENASKDLLENAKHKFPGATLLCQDGAVNINVYENRASPTLQNLLSPVNQSFENSGKPSSLDDVLPPYNLDNPSSENTQNLSKKDLFYTCDTIH
ncbi:hypothetical protein CDAR_236991 [Caerostris darwini]|uniref:Uncharacterized protein n=1 Tax=Caerostris darwini TaxID=1538125 RepID=A0AAV4W2P4_9ARAC|nr:hypothetical protein CDAR_236991 [Caerostris darwini]